jgi:hypothetical protein
MKKNKFWLKFATGLLFAIACSLGGAGGALLALNNWVGIVCIGIGFSLGFPLLKLLQLGGWVEK